MQSATAALERARQPSYGMTGASPTAQASMAFLDNVSEQVGDFLFSSFSLFLSFPSALHGIPISIGDDSDDDSEASYEEGAPIRRQGRRQSDERIDQISRRILSDGSVAIRLTVDCDETNGGDNNDCDRTWGEGDESKSAIVDINTGRKKKTQKKTPCH